MVTTLDWGCDRVGASPPTSLHLPRESWDAALAKTAKAWAKKCKFKHNTNLEIPGKMHPTFPRVGENIWTGTATVFSVDAALSDWFNEVESYDFSTNRCTGMCGHYTQVVWAESYKVGCAVHFCNTVEHFSQVSKAAHFVCNYGPAFSACLLALLLLWHSSGSYEPSTLPDIRDPKFIEECVETHNQFRSQVNPPASNMQYMSWDPDLAKTAKGWAKKCLFKHNTHLKEPGKAHPKFTPVGENLWTGSLPVFTVKGAITSWYNEVKFYTYDTRKCSKVCGHYTQRYTFAFKTGIDEVKLVGCLNNMGSGNYPWHPYTSGAACSGCGGEQCTNNLCRNAERDKVIDNSKWRPDWDRPACDEYCISVIVLRLLLLILTILATWLIPKYWSLAPASG
ncbi:hypothetical protein WISP_138215 [Willisornis vidua]|uniref:SCP domain-containing protein n=1 Tax=Willisornis vidua TaxID=1566151 RepID=A0ABQ9CTR2_9PASS|nr:hypothetical protein WISP_138215 [Willisornis vidua]